MLMRAEAEINLAATLTPVVEEPVVEQPVVPAPVVEEAPAEEEEDREGPLISIFG